MTKLITPIVTFAIGVLLIIIGNHVERPDNIAIWTFAAFMMLLSIVTLYIDSRHELLDAFTREQEAKAITPATEALQLLRRFDPRQLAIAESLLQTYPAYLRVVAGDAPLLSLVVGADEEVPLDFIYRYLDACIAYGQKQRLYPIRMCQGWTYPRAGQYARILYDYIINSGWAAPAAGNNSGRWHSNGFDSCAESVGYFRLKDAVYALSENNNQEQDEEAIQTNTTFESRRA